MTEKLSPTPKDINQAFRYLDNPYVGDEEAPNSTAGDTIYQATCSGEVPSLPTTARVKINGRPHTLIYPTIKRVITPDGNTIIFFNKRKPTS